MNLFQSKKSGKHANAAHVLTFSLILFALLTSCTVEKNTSDIPALKEIHPGILEGYLLQDDLPNSLELIPPPPEQGSAAFTLDQEISRRSLELRSTLRFEKAIKDANLMFPEAADAFSSVLNIPITEENTPYLYILLRRTLTDAGLSTYTAKNHYARGRPFMLNDQPVCTPEDEELLRKDGSYPSGHTAIGWAWALILCEIFPEKTNAILARGREFGESRIVCNVHWQSDVNEGRFMGAATVARLHADLIFLADMEAAKAEIAALRTRR
jgi:acid phosphatase (class A)